MFSGDDSYQWPCRYGMQCEEALRRARNCDEVTNKGFYLDFAPRLRRCPHKVVTPISLWLISLYGQWERTGETPFSSMPAWCWDAFDVVSETRDYWLAKRQNKVIEHAKQSKNRHQNYR